VQTLPHPIRRRIDSKTNPPALSRLIKKPDQPYNDGHRHMVKYSRFNQTIQIIVDYKTYLPTMSVITTNHVSRHSKSSVMLVGTMNDRSSEVKLLESTHMGNNYTSYGGCISSRFFNSVLYAVSVTIQNLTSKHPCL